MSLSELAGFVHEFQPPTSADAPVLLLLHGTGGDQHQLLGFGRLVATDAALLAPRGKVDEADGVPRFFRRIPTGDGSAYPFTFDEEEVVQRSEELVSFLEDAVEHYGLQGRMVVAAGFSNGANMAAAVLMTHPQIMRGAVLAAPMPVMRRPARSDLSHVAVLLSAGRMDPIATPDRVEELADQLADRDARVEVHWHAGGHELGRSTVEAARSWLGKLRQATATDPLP